MKARALVLVVLASLCACSRGLKRKKPVEPMAASQGAIFGSVILRGHEFPNVIPHRAEEMYFAQVLPSGEIDADRPLLSNWGGDGMVYLLNIPPGKYIPLTVSWYHRRLRYQGKLPPEEAKLWTVEVGPGQIAFLGNNTLRTEWTGFGQAFLNLLKQGASYIPPFLHPTTSIDISTPRLDRSPEVEAHALRKARETLKGTLWAAAVDRRLTALGNPPDRETTGFVFKTEKPRIDAGAFKYVEILDWGAPAKAPGGLRWREPKGRAEVVVSYMKEGVDGYKPRERYLDDMRSAGAPEDSHVLSDVIVSSRAAHVARYTTYVYPRSALEGSSVRVFRTETLLVPAVEGYYVLRYRARREEFDQYYKPFRHFMTFVEYNVPVSRPKAIDIHDF